MQGIELVVFDFDQTLVDSLKGFNAAFEKIKEEFDFFLKNNGYKIDVGKHSPLLKTTMRDLDVNRQYDRDLWWNILLEKLKVTEIQFNEVECKKLTKIYWDTGTEHTILFPDTLEILDYMKGKGYLIGLLTDTDGTPGFKEIRLEKSGILEYFDGVMIAGDEVPEIKPDPNPFLKLASHLGVSPDASVMVGDKPFTDIKGGKAAGFYTILILHENWEVDPVPDYQIQSLTELKSIL